jgi:phosphoribosylamine--glycine ligase
VVVAEDFATASSAIRELLGGALGDAGKTLVVEELLEGEELSVIALCDGERISVLAPAQDHKRVFDADRGPNTGGMGAYSPAPVVTPAIHARIMREVIEPTVIGLAREGTPYTGFLYAGLMIAADGTPNVLEFNCRFGDPETQPVMARLRSDLVALCDAAIDGRLDRVDVEWDPRAALGVVMAAGGYPDAYRKGDAISGLEQAAVLPGKVFHAGTSLDGERVVTSGGRVLCAVGLGATVKAAQEEAYRLVDVIRWSGAQYRHDIGHRAISRLK